LMGASFDAFGRLRTSGTGQRLDVEFLYDKQVEYFDETTNNGTVTHNANSRDLTLSLADANNGSFAKMESYPVPYTPGNSHLVEMTAVLDLAGIGGGTFEVFRRSSTSGSAVEETVPQSSWTNLGSGMDWNKAHIFVIDFQSLKVGSVRFGFNSRGKYEHVAQLDHDGKLDVGYWQLANGSVYYHLYTTGGNTYMEIGYGDDANAVGFRYKIAANASATMKAICCTVKSEGGSNLLDIPGLPRTANNGITEITASTTKIPILSVRAKSTFQSKPNLVLGILESVQVSATQPTLFTVVVGGTLTTPSWADVNTTHSAMEYDVSAAALTGGIDALSFYVPSGTGNSPGAGGAPFGREFLWNRQGSETGIVTVAAIKTGTSDSAVLASLNWTEIR
jgi:hypothetical protein